MEIDRFISIRNEIVYLKFNSPINKDYFFSRYNRTVYSTRDFILPTASTPFISDVFGFRFTVLKREN